MRAGYRPIGLDISGDQLRIARRRLESVVQADACHLPIRDDALEVAIGMHFHTDVEDFAAVVREIARCLIPGGRFVYLGLHPCFIGPFIDRRDEAERQRLTIAPGYGQVGWSLVGSGGGMGLWSRVGGHHKTLASFIGAFAEAPLNVGTVREFPGGGTVLPRNVGVIAEKPRG